MSGNRVAAWLPWVGLAIVVVALLGSLGRFIETSGYWLDYPYPRPGSEGLILYESLLYKHGGDVYAPITPERFISGPYPPLYYAVAASVLPPQIPDLTTPDAVTSFLRPGREIALFCTAVAAALMIVLAIYEGGFVARGRNIVWAAAAGGLVGGLLLLTLPQVLVWATRFRGDMLMIALTAAGLLAIAAGAPPGAERPRFLWLVFGALFFALAFYTKQTALAGPAAAALYLLVRDWRLGLKWCGLMLLAALLPFAALDIATGHWFYLKMVVYHSLPYSWTTLSRLVRYALLENQWPLLLAALAYALFRFTQAATTWRATHARDVPLLSPIFLLAALANLPTAGVVGADHNHLLMLGLAMCACVGSLCAWLLTGAVPLRTALRLAATAAALVCLLGYVVTNATPSTAGYGPDLARRSPEQQEQLRKIALYIHNTPGDLFFADDPGMLALAGKSTTYDDPFTMAALAPQGKWDEAYLREMLRQGKFARLLLSCDVPATIAQREAQKRGEKLTVGNACRADTLTDGVLDAINSGYTLLFRDVLFTYAPKER